MHGMIIFLLKKIFHSLDNGLEVGPKDGNDIMFFAVFVSKTKPDSGNKSTLINFEERKLA